MNELDGAAALPDLKSYEDMSQISQHSSPTSNSGGHFAMPMGASACSMARSSSNNIQQYPTGSMSSHRSSPVLYDNAVLAAQPAIPTASTSAATPGRTRDSNLKSSKNGQPVNVFFFILLF